MTVDVSFISLKVLLPVIRGWFPSGDNAKLQGKESEEIGYVITLIKPQFEAGRKQASKGEGVIRDPAVHREVSSGGAWVSPSNKDSKFEV